MGNSEKENVPEQSNLQIFKRFLKFGFLAWGGPVAQIAMIRDELVDSEKWISSKYFNRLLAIYQVLPGPEAHEICVYMGMLAKGRWGGFLAGLGFMLPGFILMLILSWLYVEFQITQSVFAGVFLGISPAVVALIVRAVHRIGSHVIINKWLWGIMIGSAIASFLGITFWVSLPLAGLVYVLYEKKKIALSLILSTVFLAIIAINTANNGFKNNSQTISTEFSNNQEKANVVPLPLLFLSGFKSGMLTFGGAYTVIPFLQDDAVNKGAWMTNREFLDGLALSGILPAPLIIFSTFVGYLGNGLLGAIVMTIGIFLPAFCFSLFFHRHLEKVIENKTLYSFLEGVSAGVVGLIAITTIELGRSTVNQTPSILVASIIFVLSLAVLYLWKNKLSVPIVVLVSGVLGFIFFGGS